MMPRGAESRRGRELLACLLACLLGALAESEALRGPGLAATDMGLRLERWSDGDDILLGACLEKSKTSEG